MNDVEVFMVSEVLEAGKNMMMASVSSYETSAEIFESGDVAPKVIDKVTKLGYIPWGEDNNLPAQVVKKVRSSDVMNPNMHFNVLVGYGRGIEVLPKEGELSDEQKFFFRRNNLSLLNWELQQDLKHFYFAVVVVFISRDRKKITRIIHKDAMFIRFEKCNTEGRIEHVFFANWEDNPSSSKDIEKIPLLDYKDPWYDLNVRLGREPNERTGQKKDENGEKYAFCIRIPTVGNKYYPFPTYQSTFVSGWYDNGVLLPKLKNAKLKSGGKVKYQVEIHSEFWEKLFKLENISDPEKKKERRKKELEEIKKFLTDSDSGDKIWTSGYYIDVQGREQRMVRIKLIDNSKEGGEYILDAEEAVTFQSYSMGVHPSMNGATPGKNRGSMSGTDLRERYTMKQALEKPVRDLILSPLYLINDVNGWPETEYRIGDLLLTTLDKGTDAKEAVIVEPKEEES